MNARPKRRRVSTPETIARDYASKIKRKYGVTKEDFQRMLAEQNGVCAICRETSDKSLHIDHNHTTGKVRGLLCNGCNLAIGIMKDSPARLISAAQYLVRS